jgi:hypothetical protein
MDVKELDLKLQVLDKIAEEQNIDCIVLGSSAAYRGINPILLERSYQRVSNRSLSCFNLGVPTIVASGVSELLDYIAQRYQPNLIILAVTPREISGDVLSWSKTQETMREWDWLTFQQGDHSVEGWLYSKLKIYGYYKAYSELYRDIWLSNDPDVLETRRRGYNAFLAGKGFLPRGGQLKVPITKKERNRLDNAYGGYFPEAGEIAAMNRMLSYHNPPQTSVVLVEAPIHPVVITDILGEQRYAEFKTELQNLADAYHTPLLFSSELNLIPADGWSDSNHLNKKGVPVYSAWLGEQIGTLVNEQQLNIDR